jgi:O-antigen/teichoic acid export membrane protein
LSAPESLSTGSSLPDSPSQAEPATDGRTADGTAGTSGRTARGLTTATAVALVLRCVGVLVGIVTNAVLARYLAPAGYGMLSLAMTLGTAAAQIADLGTATTVATRIVREQQQAPRILATGLAIRSSVAVLASVGLVAAALAGQFDGSGSVIAIVAVATPLSAASVLTAGAMARFRPETASVLALVQGVAWLAAVSLVVRAGGAVEVLAWCFVAVAMLQTAIGVAMNRRIVPVGRPSLVEARRIFALSWPLALSSLATAAYYRLDSVILFNTKGAAEVGFYSAAYKLLDVAQLAPAVLVAPLLPLVAASVGASLRRRELILSLAIRTGALIGVGIALILIVLAVPLVDLLFGRDFTPANRPLTLLAIAFAGITLGWVGTTVNTALGRVRPIATLTVSVAVVSLALQVWACPRWGATGAAAVTAGTELAVGIGSCALASRAMAAPLPLRELAITMVAGATVVAVALLSPLPAIVEAVLAGAVFAVVVLAARVVTADDARRVLSRREL